MRGGGIVAYSGYVDAANKGVDETLLSDVSYALQLALVSDDVEGSGSVIIQNTGTKVANASDDDMESFLTAAMENSFGSGWESMSLSYDKWDNDVANVAESFQSSSFSGDEEQLLKTISSLVTTLNNSGVVEKIDEIGSGGGLSTYLSANGLTSAEGTTKSNAVVLYLAEETAGQSESITTVLNNAISNASGETYGSADYVTTVMFYMLYSFMDAESIGTMPGCAAVYAYVEGFIRTQDNSAERIALLNSQTSQITMTGTDPWEPVKQLMQAMAVAARDDIESNIFQFYNFSDYINDTAGTGQAAADIQAYTDALGTVLDYQDLLDLTSETCYTDISTLVSTVLNTEMESDEIGVFVVVSGGEYVLITAPALD